jgi:dTDP-4-dehydrorhamnose reductase
LQRALAPLCELIALDRSGAPSANAKSAGSLCGDLADRSGISETIKAVRPDVVVNAAAYTAVDKAELEPQLARNVNALAPGVIAAAAMTVGAALVHYSTDYVFDGSGDAARDETARASPLSIYGQSKWEGEVSIRASGCRHLIFRTSWIYANRGANFLRTILRLASDRSELRVVNDQVGAPTGAELIADVTAHAIRQFLLRPDLGGTYNLAAAGETSWHGYASFAIASARRFGFVLKTRPEQVLPITSSEFQAKAARPMNSRLEMRKLEKSFDLRMPDWRVGVERTVREICEAARK